VSAALTLLLGDPALTAACAVGLGAGIVAGRFLAAGRGRLDGDAFGAVVEVTFAAALLVTLIWPG
jgi:cobalamin synthase